MPNVNLMGPTDWAAQQEDILRRRKMAELMQAQSMQAPEQFATNGIKAPISWTQGLAKLLQGYVGGEQQRSLTAEQQKLGQDYTRTGNEALIKGLRAYDEYNSPKPDQVIAPDAPMGEAPVGPPQTIPGAPGDPKRATEAAMAMWGQHPATEGYARALIPQLLKGQERTKLGQGEKLFEGGREIASNAPKPEHVTIEGKVYEVTPTGLREIGGPGKNVDEWGDTYVLGGAQVQRNSRTGEIRQAVSRPPVTNVINNMPGQEKAFEQQLGKSQAEALMEGRKGADDAKQIIDTVNVGRKILKSGMVTGFGANALVSMGQALKQAGVNMHRDATANAQAYTATMAGNVGRIIKQFGSGTGLSDADREYATKMAGGLITLDKAAIEKILDINERAARNVIRLHNKRSKGIKSVIPLEVDEPQFSGDLSPQEMQELQQLRQRFGNGR